MIQKNLIKSAPDVIVKAVLPLYNQGKFEEILSRSSHLIEKYPQIVSCCAESGVKLNSAYQAVHIFLK